MKRRYIIAIVIALFIPYVILLWPTTIDHNYEGVIVKLEDRSIVRDDVGFRIHGKVYKNLILKRTFVGNIKLNNIDDIVEMENSDEMTSKLFDLKLKLRFDDFGRTNLQYFMMQNSYGYYQDIGMLYTNRDFDRFTISIVNKESHTWSTKEGYIIVLPAKTVVEALTVADSIMDDSNLEINFNR